MDYTLIYLSSSKINLIRAEEFFRWINAHVEIQAMYVICIMYVDYIEYIFGFAKLNNSNPDIHVEVCQNILFTFPQYVITTLIK